ncbi:uncharacterized protein LOC135057877 isoform X2 [Pseudophryne corroboree]|uniref:uncharacterized protein LOC135057877 isoform X2 n=1 Tax=Pseudophryne corroboree TaxID=495146 RepID=UPI0030813B33
MISHFHSNVDESHKFYNPEVKSSTEMILKTFFLLLAPVLALETCIKGASNVIKQHPKRIFVNSGETAIINCTVTKQMQIIGIYLRKRFTRIMYINDSNKCILENNYEDRLTCSGSVTNFSVTLRNLTEDDTDFYLCDGAGNTEDIYGEGTLLIVHAALEEKTKLQSKHVCGYDTNPPSKHNGKFNHVHEISK